MSGLAVVSDAEGEAPLLALHGLGGDHVQALGQVDAHPAYRRIAPDMRAHGDTREVGDPDTLTLERFAAEVREVVPAGPVRVIGVSMGAGIALHLAALEEGLVERIVLVRPAWLDEPMPGNLEVFPRIAELLAAGRDAAALDEVEEYRAIAAESPAMAASLRRQFDRPRARERAAVLDRIPRSSPAPRSVWRGIRVPTLVLGAPGDPVHPIAFAREIADGIPDAVFAELPPKGLDPREHDAALRRVATAFLAAP